MSKKIKCRLFLIAVTLAPLTCVRLAVPSRQKELGRFYIVDLKSGAVEPKIDLTKYGRQHGILKVWEEIE